jgi:hypothetical protein
MGITFNADSAPSEEPPGRVGVAAAARRPVRTGEAAGNDTHTEL